MPNWRSTNGTSSRIRLLHASPRGVYTRVFQEDSRETLWPMFDSTDFTGHGAEPDVVGYGGIHEAYMRTFETRILFAVGRVGNPLDRLLACYAMLAGLSDDAPGPLAITLVRLPYDIERAIREATQEGMPDREPYAVELRTARYQRGAQAPRD